MAFQLKYWGPCSTGQNASFTIDHATQTAIAQGTSNAFCYNGLDAGASIDDLQVADYFLPVVNQLKLGDFVFVSGTDTNAALYVSDIAYPDNGGLDATITLSSVAGGPVVTADIADNAVTYAKFQQTPAHTIVANPTGSTADVSAATLSSELSFSGTNLQISTNGITYAKLQQSTAKRLLGNATASTANVEEVALGQTLVFTTGPDALNVLLRGSGGLLSNSFGVYIDSQYIATTTSAVTPTQMLTLASVPVKVATASSVPSGSAIIIATCVVQVVGMTTQYADGSNLILTYGNSGGPLASVPVANTVVNGQVNTSSFLITGGLGTIPSLRSDMRPADIYVTVDGANYTTGDGTLIFNIRYYSVPLS